jgi:4-amino-4-deoxy-L-arabinose transferase-like glycosyltransferase
MVPYSTIPPLSDSASYVELARSIAEGRPYYIDRTWAYWPPGYPMYLSFFLGIGLTVSATILVTNILQYLASSALIYLTGLKIGGPLTARMSTSLLSLWPSLVTATGIAQKEQLLIPIILGIFYLSITSDNCKTPIFGHALRGILLGFACLIQPSLIFFSLVIFIIEYILKSSFRKAFKSTFITSIIAIFIIAPWSIRNYHHFNQFVMISTNGGSNFYRSNNELATGGYTEPVSYTHLRAHET